MVKIANITHEKESKCFAKTDLISEDYRRRIILRNSDKNRYKNVLNLCFC